MLAESEAITGWKERSPEESPAQVDALMRLALAVLVQAIRDAGKASTIGEQARAWLLSPDAELYLALAGIEPGALDNWMQAGAVIPKQGQK